MRLSVGGPLTTGQYGPTSRPATPDRRCDGTDGVFTASIEPSPMSRREAFLLVALIWQAFRSKSRTFRESTEFRTYLSVIVGFGGLLNDRHVGDHRHCRPDRYVRYVLRQHEARDGASDVVGRLEIAGPRGLHADVLAALSDVIAGDRLFVALGAPLDAGPDRRPTVATLGDDLLRLGEIRPHHIDDRHEYYTFQPSEVITLYVRPQREGRTRSARLTTQPITQPTGTATPSHVPT